MELFGGIGACTKALKNIEIDVSVGDYVEIDKYAVKSYNAINNTNFEPQDITKWNKDINIDLIMHGSPCQDFSVAGKQAGGDEGSGTRSSLMYETIRIIEKLHPKYIIWENVKNLLSKKHKHNFDNYINKLDKLGYNSYYQILDAQDYGIPQHRERVYTVSIRKDIDNNKFTFPEKIPLQLKLKDLLEDVVDDKYYLTEKGIGRLIKKNNKLIRNNNNPEVSSCCLNANKKVSVQDRIYDEEGIAATVTASEFRPKIAERKMFNPYNDKEIKDIAPTQTANCGCSTSSAAVLISEDGKNYLKIRKLTPLECWRLMGFDDKDFYKAKNSGISDSQLYKQAGNSIVVKVLEKIFLNLFKGD